MLIQAPRVQQAGSPAVLQSPAPQVTTSIAASQALDVGSLINSIMPLMMMVLMFQLITPMFKTLGKATT